MANIIKVDNSIIKRTTRVEKKRKLNTKSKEIYFLIFCEGEKTEPNYFKSFKTNVNSYVHSLDVFGEGSNTKDLVKKTIKFRDKSSQIYDSVWAVFDKDNFSSNNFNGAIELAKKNNINVGWTNEAFELWYLLHFQYRNTSMDRNEYKQALEREVNAAIEKKSITKNYKKFKYKKNSLEMYAILEKYGNQPQAIKNAEKLILTHSCTNYSIHNPCTKIHLLVQELNGTSKELIEQLDLKK